MGHDVTVSRLSSLPPIDYRALRIPQAPRVPPECEPLVARARREAAAEEAGSEPAWKERWRRLLARRRSTPS